MSVKRVVVTGGAGQIAYSLLFRIANGELFGPHQPVSLHILDLPDFEKALQGVVMEMEDCLFPQLQSVKIGSDPKEIFEGADVLFLVGSKPRGPGMERKDLLADNGKIFALQGKVIDQAVSENASILVVGNPCNTNCLIAKHFAPHKKFFAMTRLDQNRAVSQMAIHAKVKNSAVTNLAIWGNHSSTMVPDFFNAKIEGERALDLIPDRKWLEGEFISKVQKRGAEVINARGKSSAASAANAALQAMKSLLEPTPPNQFFSMGVPSKGNPYGIDENLIFSFPCRCNEKNEIEIVKGLSIDPFLKEKIAITQKELQEERELVANLLR